MTAPANNPVLHLTGDIMFRKLPAIAAATVLTGLLAALLAGCGTPPKDLDLALAKSSAAGVYRVALVPPAQAPAINQMHSWQVKLALPDGTPVHGASFRVDG